MKYHKCVIVVAFCNDLTIMIRKTHPDKQKGKLNGIGGKGKPPLDPNTDCWTGYLNLWDTWAQHNDVLLKKLYIKARLNKNILGDFFGSADINQTHALSVILNKRFLLNV